MHIADQIADYILFRAHSEGDYLHRRKLCMLVYYAQAWWLAIHHEPLFDDRIEAWCGGPVIPGLIDRFDTLVPILDLVELPELDAEVIAHLEDVLSVYGEFTQYSLERIVCSEGLWKLTRGRLQPDEPCTEEIPHHVMRIYYSDRLDGGDCPFTTA